MSIGEHLRILAGTSAGLYVWGAREATHLAGRDVTALVKDDTTWWVLVEGQTAWRSSDGDGWREIARVSEGSATCLLPTAGGLFVGTAGAHLSRLEGREFVRLESFERVPGRQEWYTPWGAPPDTRSMTRDSAGTIYVNVHVGGVVRSTDQGRSWSPTLDIESDVHQVLAANALRLVLAAAAVGLGISADAGLAWRFETEGLHGRYLRAVAVAGDTILVTASKGPRGKQAAVYRRRLDQREPFERCRHGLPDWFGSNIDTGCLAASGPVVAFGTDDGRVFLSADQGRSWGLFAKGLPPVQCVALG